MEQPSPGQIKKLLRQLKQRQEQYLYYLGQLAYQAGEQEKLTEPEMLEAFNTLKDIQGQIAQAESSLEQIKAAKEAAQNPRCPNCGGATAKNAPFCPNCGASLVAPAAAPVAAPAPAAAPAAPAPTGKACASCGAPLDEDAVFCGNCGAKTEAQAAPVAAPEPPAAPAAAPENASPEAAEAAAVEGEAAPAEEDVPELEETLACPGCGTDILEKDVRFCPSCGTKVRE